MCPLAVGYLRHCFFTTHTDNLKRNAYVKDAVSGDVFVLKVSDLENGRGFYVDTKPEDLNPDFVNRICEDAAKVILEDKDLASSTKWLSKRAGRKSYFCCLCCFC